MQPNIPDEFDTVRYRIIKILQQFPETRNSDKLLYHRYYKLFEGIDTKLDIVQAIPESLSRARRKIQELNPDLAAEPEFEEARQRLQREFREAYARI